MAGYFVPNDLVEYVNNALRESEFPTPGSGYFAPKSTLNAITNSSVTQTIWSNSKSYNSLMEWERNLVEFISGQAREMFAIGIRMSFQNHNLGSLMWHFMTHNKSDRSLPMSDAEIEAIWPGPRNSSQRRDFQDKQRLFRPHGFPRRNRFSVITLQPKIVLPILKSEQRSRGQFGIVYKVTLHEEFLDQDDPIRKVRENQRHPLHDAWSSCILLVLEHVMKSLCNLLIAEKVLII